MHVVGGDSDPGKLELVKDSWLVCADSGYKYPIRSGIPVMLVEDAERVDEAVARELEEQARQRGIEL